jgi:HTH-type transcriptional regulator/antitoxin HipB
MRIGNARDLGLYVRECRTAAGHSQTELAARAGVSRRWLSDLEGGKATAEFGLILRTLRALDLIVDIQPTPKPDGVDLDAILERLSKPDA